MQQEDFLKKNVFNDLENLNKESGQANFYIFSEIDFENVLKKSEYFGIGIYKIEAYLNSKSNSIVSHEDVKKKATDPRWYKKAFSELKSKNSELTYSATYKVSNKLLAREKTKN
jgi:hypothetical protein|tara:strand:+ start:214 stop:555 length:342 start_codon:yes stop_codon:yes gene_type:complete